MSTGVPVARNVGYGVLKNVPRQSVAAAIVLVTAVALAIFMARTEAVLAPLWLLGMGAGSTLQRSRFCFASAFRDIFLFGNSHIMRGVLVGLGVATIGFAIIMNNDVPFPAFGALPREAHILPVGLTAITGGLLLGSAWSCPAGACPVPFTAWPKGTWALGFR